MTPLFALALILLSLSPLLLRVRYGAQWLLRPFGLFVLMAIIYHGAAEILIRLTHADELVTFRPSIEDADWGMLIAGDALLSLTLGYMATHPRRRIDTAVSLDDLRLAFDWRPAALLLAPLTLATVAGAGYNNGQALEGGGVSLTGLAYQFFIPMTVITAFSLLIRAPRRFLVIVAGQSLILAVAGQRLEILLAGGMLWLLAARVGLKPARRQMVGAALVAALLAIAIGSVRASEGRDVFYSDNGFQARAGALFSGITNPQTDSVHGGDAIAEAGLRLDSNDWAGQVHRALETTPPIGLRPLGGGAMETVPSVLYPNKLVDFSLIDRSPELSAIYRLHLPEVDYLPGHVTFVYPLVGFGGLLLFNLVVGALLGLLDGFALGRASLYRLAALLLLAQSALFFERGWLFYLVTGRSFLVLVAGLAVWRWLRRLTGAGAKAEQEAKALTAAR